MNVPLIQETQQAAREKLKEYRTAIHTRADREYEQVAAAYVQLAKGRPLIRLTEAFATTPLDDRGRVRLAIGPALGKQIRMSTWNGRREFTSAAWRGPTSRWAVRVLDQRAASNHADGYSLVPIIPPNVRGTHDLSSCCILWEVEQWADAAIRATPDCDPLLIRMIGDDLYVVLGEWDLTPLEQAIMAGRRLA